MAYKIEKPIDEITKADFIVEHNHKNGLTIVETENAIFALEKNEIMKNGEPQNNPNYDAEKIAKEQKILSLKEELFELDLKSIRAIRANDIEYIQKYETTASNLRAQIIALNTH